MKLEQAQDLCKLAHAGQYRRPRAVNAEEYRKYELEHNPPNFINEKGASIELTDSGWVISEAFHSHPFTVAKMVHNEQAKILAYLHDILEKTSAYVTWKNEVPYIVFDSNYYQLTINQSNCLLAITHDKQISYKQYIKQVCKYPIAAEVKLADITHNLATQPNPAAKHRYLKAVPKLFEVLLKD